MKKTHDIANILKDCGRLDNDFSKLKKININKLTEYGVNVRYDDIPFINSDTAKETISIAEQVGTDLF
ncbi:MAG: HEPN domain-containing protein [bacterium]